MHNETELIVNAIESLKQEGSIFKDYIFSIASAFFTSLLGAGIAYKSFRYQEDIKIEKEKMDIANKWTLLADEARSNLISIKQNYHGKLTENPIQRAAAIPTILFTAKPIVEDYSQLSFLVPKQSSDEYPKWSQIPRIRTMIHNYNYVQELWLKRNEIERPIREKIVQQYSTKAFVNVSPEQIFECVGEANFALLVDLTEKVIALTDDLLVESDDFLANFSVYVKTHINSERLKRYGSVLNYSNNGNEKLLAMLERSPNADYSSVTTLFGATTDQLKQRYSTGYESGSEVGWADEESPTSTSGKTKVSLHGKQ